jgi:hypothetical protein
MTRATPRFTTDGIVGAQSAMLVGEDPSGEVYIHTRERSTERGPLSCAVVGALAAAPAHPLPRATAVTGRACPRRWSRS